MLTQEQIDRFHVDGYLIIKSVIKGRELQMLQDAADAVIEEGKSRVGEADHRYAIGPDGREVYWRSERLWERDPIFRAVTVNPVLLENIGQCIGHSFYPWNDSLVVKLPYSGAAVKWHQDPPYRNPDRETTFSIPNFTTDIYLDRAGSDNGCVYAIPGHHLVGHIDLEPFCQDELFDKALPLVLEPGDVLFHCLSTPHGSRANTSGSTRRIFYVHYLCEEVYQDGYSAESWASEKPGWSPSLRLQLEGMQCDRELLGVDGESGSNNVTLDDDGFNFQGGPATPLRYWSELTKSISVERKQALKDLELLQIV